MTGKAQRSPLWLASKIDYGRRGSENSQLV